MTKHRVEKDSMGEVRVPSDCYWGAQTERSKENFPIGSERMPPEVIHALVLIKKAAAIVNAKLGVLSSDKRDLICAACDDILQGELKDQFPLVVWQTGSGTQTNMNVNEVISNRAIEKAGGVLGSKQPIHPNDDVNHSQSSNCAFPSAMHISAALLIRKSLLPALTALYACLEKKAEAFKDVIKVGRTHLMDAAPLTLGQEFSGYAAQIKLTLVAIESALEPLSEIALGGTAVGTGLNAPAGFADQAAEEISRLTGIQFTSAENKFASIASHDAIVWVSAALRQVAVALMKIANDIRLLGSGPRCGFYEIRLPANEPGSSIMPGKVNPTQCEAVTMVAVQVMGNDAAIAYAGSLGTLELNTYKPVMIYNLIQSIHLLADVARSFCKKCLEGIEPNRKQIAEYVERSLMTAAALNASIGYDKAAQIVKKAYAEDTSLKEAAVQLGFMSAEEFESLVDLEAMVRPTK